MKNIDTWCLRFATLYFVAGVLFGIVMAARHDFALMPLHAHLNLLGWVSLSLFGLYYRALPAAAASRLAQVHVVLYLPAHFAQMVLLGLYLSGTTAVEPALALASSLVGLAVLCFVVNVWKHTGAPR